MGHIEFLVHQHPQDFVHRATLNPFPAHPVFVPGIAPALVQDIVVDLVELQEVLVDLSLQPFKAPLDGISTLQHI